MIEYKSLGEIELIRKSSLLVGKTHAEVARHIKPGVTTARLDKIAEEFIRDHGAIPAFKGYGDFPGTLCISVNDVVVHGIPGEQVIQDGDLVSVDCGVLLNGFYGDSAYSYGVGNVREEVRFLLERTKQSLYIGIETARQGKRIGDIGYEIQNFAEGFGYSVVRELVGHGIGRKLHESPEVPNYGRRGTGVKLQDGLVICIEPMINLGKKGVKQEKDGWTIRTLDGQPSAHFEHQIAMVNGKAEILSSFEEIERVVETWNN